MSHKLRAKEGHLEMLKSEGINKKRWRSHLFKVSAQTYLLCFKTENLDLAKPSATLLLAHVQRIDTAAIKDASFPFAVYFKGKGSPWVLNATSNAQRIEWMEAIQPGAGVALSRLSRATTLPAMPQQQQQLSSSFSPASPSSISPSLLSESEDPLNSSWPSSSLVSSKLPPTAADHRDDDDQQQQQQHQRHPHPEEYMIPVPMDLAQTLPAGFQFQAQLPPTTPPKPKRTVLFNHSSSDTTAGCPERAGDNNVEAKPPPKPKPRPRQHPPHRLPSTSSPSPSSPSQKEPQPDYLPLLADNSTDDGEGEQGGGGRRNGGQDSHVPDMVERMAQTFSTAQIGMLIEMLRELQPAGQSVQHHTAAAYEGEDPSVLKGDLEKALVATPSLQSYKMLITDADSNESYEPRPAWAKAVCEESKRLPEKEDDTQELELTDLLAISRSNLSDFNLIGEGQFGQVFKATLQKGAEVMEVAVKTTKAASSEKDKDNFMREMRIMSHMMHPNIVRLYGLVEDDVVSPWIVLEFLPHGDLKSFLMKNKRPVLQLVKFMVDIAMGMHYLSERGLIHRDLAARNVLVGQNELCKVADFGLLRELPRDDSIYHMQTSVPCPVRWMPPESISQRRFSTASDVWSYGVLLWEMFNPRKMPYEKYSNIEVATKVIQGYRMATPRVCPPVVARIMRACWHNLPEKRPSFLLISTLLTTQSTFDP